MRRTDFVLGEIWRICACNSASPRDGDLLLTDFFCRNSPFPQDCQEFWPWRRVDLNYLLLSIIPIQLEKYFIVVQMLRVAHSTIEQPLPKDLYRCVNNITNRQCYSL